jgi:hypothetical protein
MLKCKQATELISQSQDRQLTTSEQIALKFHLLICRGCNNCNKQIGMIHQAMQRIRKP